MASGRLTLEQRELGTLPVLPTSLDQAFAVDVNLFWTRSPAAELGILSEALRPGPTHSESLD